MPDEVLLHELILGIVAGFLHLVAFGIYNIQMIKGKSVPNPATWFLWLFVSTLNCITYFFASEDWVKTILPAASSAACIVTFSFALFRGKFSRLKLWHWPVLMVGVVSIVVWWKFKDASFANLIMQFSILISFIPTISGVWQEPKTEQGLPWFIWSFAYILGISVVILRWREGHWIDLVYPFNCLILHGLVGLLALRQDRSITRPLPRL